jgi:adenine-specific DNA-methyltransferase
MGSKRELIEYIVSSISEIYDGESICDLFAGTSILSGAIGHKVPMHSNDIQEYSAVLAKTYLGDYDWNSYSGLHDTIISKAQKIVDQVHNLYPELAFEYNSELSLNEFNAIEQEQQELIYNDFNEVEHHLFIKNYSGTYWSFEQCLWIDAIRTVAMEYSQTPVYHAILSSLMFAMAYNAQSTGHYAQYRDAYDIDSMNDIILYRNKQILPYFKKKLFELMNSLGRNMFNHVVTTLDYRDCLDILPERSLIYADPPYAFVHYSRFYHALETLVKYDYPEVTHKGRYRNDRHQSPFCKRTTVSDAFKILFEKTDEKQSKLILSYSNTGMISLEKILDIAKKVFKDRYHIMTKAINYTHSTMGRFDDKSREVKEYLVIAHPKNNNV